MCLALSVAKIFAEGQLFRKLCFAYTGILFILYFISLIILTVSCPGTPWWQLDFTRCFTTASGFDLGTIIVVVRKFLPSFIVIISLFTDTARTVDFIADILLIAGPVYMLWGIKFRPRERMLIRILFSASILTILASVMYFIVWYAEGRLGPDSRLIFTMMAHLQVGFLPSFIRHFSWRLTTIYLILRRCSPSLCATSFSSRHSFIARFERLTAIPQEDEDAALIKPRPNPQHPWWNSGHAPPMHRHILLSR